MGSAGRPRLAFVADPPEHADELAGALRISLDEVFRRSGFVPPPPPSPPGAAPPETVSPHIAHLSVTCAWDMYHEERPTSPDELRGRPLEAFAVRFVHGRSAWEAVLAEAHGAPRTPAGPRPLRRYGPFFVDAADTDAITLEWYAVEPDWAKPPVDAPARGRAVADLAAALAGTQTAEQLEAVLAGLPAGVGLRADRSYVEMEPPMRATECAEALGIADPVAFHVDVHMASWRIATQCGPWRVLAELDGFPTGPDRRLGDKDVVRRLDVRLAG